MPAPNSSSSSDGSSGALTLLPNAQGVKIYNVSVGKSIPQWLSEKKKKSLRYDQGQDY